MLPTRTIATTPISEPQVTQSYFVGEDDDIAQSLTMSPAKKPKVTEHAAVQSQPSAAARNTDIADAALVEACDFASTLEPEQQKIWYAALDGKSLFFTGAAGTGKSHLLRHIIKHMVDIHGESNVFVTAPSGIAACNISGCTIHHFAGIGLGEGSIGKLINIASRNKNAVVRWLRARVLIIDEISMVSKEMFDLLNEIAQHIRENRRPFGGIQIILCGDFYQLPPVPKSTPGQPQPPVCFCFESDSWKALITKANSFLLTKIYRQSGDPEFTKILTNARLGYLPIHHHIRLRTCVGRLWESSEVEDMATHLYPHRSSADQHNITQLRALTGETHTYVARDHGEVRLLKDCPAPQTLSLRVGAQVLLVKNLDTSARLVNGTRGKVVRFEGVYEYDRKKKKITEEGAIDPGTGKPKLIEKEIEVFERGKLSEWLPVIKFETGTEMMLEKTTWDIKTGEEIVASRLQYPLCLAWAITIHKSQGMTLKRVILDISNVFADGQAYVALSRATSLMGIRITQDFSSGVVRASAKVARFYQAMMSEDSGTYPSYDGNGNNDGGDDDDDDGIDFGRDDY